MKKRLLLLPLLLLFLLPCLSVKAGSTVYDYGIVSVTQTSGDTIVVTVQAEYCFQCHPDERSVEVRIISSMGLFDETLVKDTDMATDWPLETLVTWDFEFTGLPLQYCDWIDVHANFWCSLCYDHWVHELDALHVIPEYPFGTIMGLAKCFAAVAAVVFIRSKRYKLPLLNYDLEAGASRKQFPLPFFCFSRSFVG